LFDPTITKVTAVAAIPVPFSFVSCGVATTARLWNWAEKLHPDPRIVKILFDIGLVFLGSTAGSNAGTNGTEMARSPVSSVPTMPAVGLISPD
jgi:hypothetical protein